MDRNFSAIRISNCCFSFSFFPLLPIGRMSLSHGPGALHQRSKRMISPGAIVVKRQESGQSFVQRAILLSVTMERYTEA